MQDRANSSAPPENDKERRALSESYEIDDVLEIEEEDLDDIDE